MLRRAVLLLVLGTAAALVAALAASARGHAQVTLRMLNVTQQRPGMDAMVANFERVYPNIKIEVDYPEATTYPSVLLTQVQAGNAPDLMSVGAGASAAFAVYALGSQGKLLDLSSSPWKKRIPQAWRKFVTVKQRIYGFPTGYNLVGMVYNKDLFQQLQLQVPKTFGELLTLCGKIRAAGKIPIAAGFAGVAASVNMANILMNEFVYNKDPNWTLERIQHKVTFAGSPLWQRAYNAVVQMRDANCFNPAPAATSTPQQYAMVASGQAVMMPASTQETAALAAINPNLNSGLFVLPADNAADTVVPSGVGQLTFAVSKDTKHPKEARMFIDFLARPKQNSLYAKLNGIVAGDDFRKGLLPAGVEAGTVRLAKAGRIVAAAPPGWPRPDLGLFAPGLVFQIAGLFTGQKTPDQILQTEDTLWAPVK
jgi:raffinose/stachyose/melibiose transport system substrate-binding protein